MRFMEVVYRPGVENSQLGHLRQRDGKLGDVIVEEIQNLQVDQIRETRWHRCYRKAILGVINRFERMQTQR